jgi:Na+/H+-translocating membrane pyrophosphatase
LAVAVAAVFVLFSAAITWQTGICYLCGAISSAFCGYVGMMTTTSANARTAKAAERGLNAALRVAFNAGSVMVCMCCALDLARSRSISISLLCLSNTTAAHSHVRVVWRYGVACVGFAGGVGGHGRAGHPSDGVR